MRRVKQETTLPLYGFNPRGRCFRGISKVSQIGDSASIPSIRPHPVSAAAGRLQCKAICPPDCHDIYANFIECRDKAAFQQCQRDMTALPRTILPCNRRPEDILSMSDAVGCRYRPRYHNDSYTMRTLGPATVKHNQLQTQKPCSLQLAVPTFSASQYVCPPLCSRAHYRSVHNVVVARPYTASKV